MGGKESDTTERGQTLGEITVLATGTRQVVRLETNAKSTRNTFKPYGRGLVSNQH